MSIPYRCNATNGFDELHELFNQLSRVMRRAALRKAQGEEE